MAKSKKEIKEAVDRGEFNNLNCELSNLSKIEPILTDFGREDLNLLRDKINEIIKSK